MAKSHQVRTIGQDRKPTGGRYKHFRKVRKYEIARLPASTTIGKLSLKVQRLKGGGSKAKVLSSSIANILDQKSGKYTQATIKLVKENAANREFARRNIITKGAIIETDLGPARVTSRPGQSGTINAVLVSASAGGKKK